jgi:FkbM family methyltransferase
LEKIRRFARASLGYRSGPYRLLSSLHTFGALARREGLGTARRLRSITEQPAGDLERLRLSNLDHPIFLRTGTPDGPTVINTVVREEYGAFSPPTPPGFMIDAGAYIGDSSAYFASKYPSLAIVALEPQFDNHALARRNLAPYGPRIDLRREALASTPGTALITGLHDGARLGRDGVPVEATSVPNILRQAGRDRIDILKMDIEGAERDVLGDSADAWLDKVGLLIVEPHGAEVEALLMATLRRNGFAARRYRSLLFCRAATASR